MKQIKKNDNFFKEKKVLVTGGAGFVGTNLILKLLEKGAKIKATFYENPPQIKNSTVQFIKTDLTKPSDCKKVVQGMDLVFMCAANTSGAAVTENTPLFHVTPNVIMNALMLEEAHKSGVQKFLYISSNAIYPVTNYPVKEEDMNYKFYEKYFPVSWMKVFTEKMCEMYATKIKKTMPTVIVRPGNIYGPYDDFRWETSHVLPALIRKVVERHNPLEVWGDGKDVKDFIYVEDFIEGLLLAMEKMQTFDPINISGGKPIKLMHALKLMLRIDNFKKPNIVFNSSKPSMIPFRVVNNSKVRKVLGFRPKTSLEEGLRKTIKWYRTIL